MTQAPDVQPAAPAPTGKLFGLPLPATVAHGEGAAFPATGGLERQRPHATLMQQCVWTPPVSHYPQASSLTRRCQPCGRHALPRRPLRRVYGARGEMPDIGRVCPLSNSPEARPLTAFSRTVDHKATRQHTTQYGLFPQQPRLPRGSTASSAYASEGWGLESLRAR
jgi:hypothetical protein